MNHKHSWLRRTEPEEHVASLANDILTFAAPSSQRLRRSLLGISYKDNSLLHYLRQSGLLEAETLIPGNESKDFLVLDTLHNPTSPTTRANVKHPEVDVVVCRHLLEHSFEPSRTLCELQRHLKPRGLLVVEVPDCELALRHFDYSILWEEHASYFTKTSLNTLLTSNGFDVHAISRQVSDGEAILIAWAFRSSSRSTNPAASTDRLGYDFVGKFPAVHKEVSTSLRNQVGKGVLVVAGANHAAANFLEVFGGSDVRIMLIDDDPNKQRRLFTRFNVEILPSPAVSRIREEVSLALVATHAGRSSDFTARIRQYLDHSTPLLTVSDFVVSRGHLL